jgi:hypothetical protein
MKLKKQDKVVVNTEQENVIDETIIDAKINSANMHLTDSDREKGNFKNFNISKKTLKKLKGTLNLFT